MKPETVTVIILGIMAICSMWLMGNDAVPVVSAIGGGLVGYLKGRRDTGQ